MLIRLPHVDRFQLPPVTIDYVTQTTQDSTFLLTDTHAAIFKTPACQPAYRKRLYPHTARTTKGSKEQTLAPKKGIFNTPYKLNIVIHRRGKSYKAACINFK